MAQRVVTKLADQTSGTATQLTVSLPATAIAPTTGTTTTGVSLAGIDGFLVLTITNAAVALAQGLTILGQDAKDATIPATTLAVFSPPGAALQNVGYSYGPNLGGSSNVAATSLFSAAGFAMDKMQFQATPGAASTVRIVVYAIRYV